LFTEEIAQYYFANIATIPSKILFLRATTSLDGSHHAVLSLTNNTESNEKYERCLLILESPSKSRYSCGHYQAVVDIGIHRVQACTSLSEYLLQLQGDASLPTGTLKKPKDYLRYTVEDENM
jgi:hypothetical protein